MRVMHTKILILLIVGAVAFTATAVFAVENYNSSRSNTSTAIVNQQVGDILLRYSIGGAEINKVTDALARGISKVDLKAMLVLIYNSAQSNVSNRLLNEQNEEGFIKEVFTELDRLGVGINEEGLQAISTPAAEDVPQSTIGEIIKTFPPEEVSAPDTEDVLAPATAKEIDDATPILFKEKEKEPQPTTAKEVKKGEPVEVKKPAERRQPAPTITPQTGIVSNIGSSGLDGVRAFHDAAMNIIQNIRSAAPEERKNLIDELRANRGTFQTEILSMRLSIRENAKELRENFIVQYRETDFNFLSRIAVAHGKGLRMINRFRSATVRFEHILGRLESRVQKLETRGVDISSVIPTIEEAKNMRVENEATLEILKAKYESLLLGENPRGVAEEARAIATELKAEIENLHAKLREIVEEINLAVLVYNSAQSNVSN